MSAVHVSFLSSTNLIGEQKVKRPSNGTSSHLQQSILLVAALLTSLCGFFNVVRQTPRHALVEFSQGTKDDPFAAARFRFEMIAGKKDYIDPNSRLLAIRHTREFNARGYLLQKSSGISGWSALGPGNIGGRIRSIIVKPTDGTQMLVGAVSGGVWKTSDGGTSWSPTMDNAAEMAIDCMVIDPGNNSVVYAGTGEGWGNVDAVYGGGIYKSTDFGSTWTILSSTTGANVWNFRNVMRLDFDPSGNLYAVTKAYNVKDNAGSYYTNGGLYRSIDGGSSWTNISSTTFSTNYFNGCDVLPISASIVLFAVKANGSTLGGIYKTTDGGANWSMQTSGLPTSNYGRIVLTKDQNSGAIYAVFASTNYGSPEYGLSGIFVSSDSGSTWSALTKPSNLASTGNISYLGTQGWYDNVIAVDPSNSNTIYVGGVDMMKSTDGGSSWTQLTAWTSGYGYPVVHADHHAIAFDPTNSNTVYSGNDGGIYKSTDGGSSWISLNNGLAITQFYGGAVSPTGADYQGGTQDNGHLQFAGSGTDWNMVYGGDGGYAAIDQSNTNTAYEEYTYLQMSKTTNNGASWHSCTTGLSDAANGSACLFIAPFSMNPDNSSTIIAGSNRVWTTTNSASNWSVVSDTLVPGEHISAVTVVNGSSPYLAFAGTTNGKVFFCASLDPTQGISNAWTDITPVGNNGAWVRRIVVDGSNTQHLYACYSGYNNDGVSPSRHVYYSSDQGSSWTDVSGDLPDVPVHSLIVDSNSSQTLYIGTETGVYQSDNGGTNWIQESSGMAANVPVDQLVWQTGTNTLFAFTHGRSAFTTTSPLPVQFTSFQTSLTATGVRLQWTTAIEVNNCGFEIERLSADKADNQWEKVGFVQGAGGSNVPHLYSFEDVNVPPGQYSYRIRELDGNGSSSYSTSVGIKVAAPRKFSLSQNFPNPFNPSTTVRFTLPIESRVLLRIFNVQGQMVQRLVDGVFVPGVHEVSWYADVSSGVYVFKLEAISLESPQRRFVEAKKMLLLK